MQCSEDSDGPEAVARWLAEQMGGRPIRFDKVEPGDEQILPEREQRELDAVPSLPTLRDHEGAQDVSGRRRA